MSDQNNSQNLETNLPETLPTNSQDSFQKNSLPNNSIPNNLSNKISKNNWPKQLYYYLILAGCVFSLAIGSFYFLEANLVRFVFQGAKSNYYYPPKDKNRCKYKTIDPYYPNYPMMEKDIATSSSVPRPIKPELNSPEEVKICEKEFEDQKNEEINRQYQQQMLNSTLTIVISILVLFGHLHFFKKLEV